MTDLRQIGQALGARYKIVGRAGIGGMATVYQAVDTKHDRQVAVKVLRPELASTLGPERFLREIRIAAQLQHPHILSLIDSGEAGGFLYYVMPYIEGESLRARLNRENELPVADVARIIRHVADALGYAHARGIVHRDIKPDNILLSERHALVMDFGVAKAVSDAAAGHDITSAGIALGTPSYMAPEQAAGDPEIDGRADLYALGIVAYELLTGGAPFDGHSLQGILAAHVIEPPRDIREVRPTIPEGMAQVIMRCLEKRPADRWQRAEEMFSPLENLRTPVTGMPPVSPPRPKPKRRYGGRWAVVAAGGLTMLVGAAIWFAGLAKTAIPVPTDDVTRVAVLYFDDNTPGGGLDYLAAGLTEALIAELTQVPVLHVVSRNGVRPYRNGGVTLDSIVRVLGVGTLVEGTVARSGDRVRVTVQMLDAEGASLESRTLERPWDELFALQDDLAEEVSGFLRNRLGQEVALRTQRAEAHSVVSWELVQRAEALRDGAVVLAGGGDTASAARDLAVADSLLAEAERVDVGWGEPTLLRGWVAADHASLGGGLRYEFRSDWLRRGLDHAGRMLARHPDDPAGLELRGVLRWSLFQDQSVAGRDSLPAAAERDLRAAVAAEPGRARAWATLSDLLRRDARFADASLAAQRALDADAFLQEASDVLFHLYETSLELKQLDDAARWCGEGARRFPTDVNFAICQLFTVALPGGPRPNLTASWVVFDRLVALTPAPSRATYQTVALTWMAAIVARAGRRDSARALLARARSEAPDGLGPSIDYYGALMAVNMNDKAGALEMLARHVNALGPERRRYLASDWTFESLWPDSAFQALVRVQ